MNCFDFVFVDEAGHAVEPECLIAVDTLLVSWFQIEKESGLIYDNLT